MQKFSLTRKQIKLLQMQLKTTHTADVYQRTLAILALNDGATISSLASLLRVDRSSIYHWIYRFKKNPTPSSLWENAKCGRPSIWDGILIKCLRSALKKSPQHLGYTAANWSVPLLQDYLSTTSNVHVSENTLRRQLHAMNYVWKRYRYFLAPDPEEEKKTQNHKENSISPFPYRFNCGGRNGYSAFSSTSLGVGPAWT